VPQLASKSLARGARIRIGQATLTVAFVFGLFPWSPSADAQPTKVPRVGILSDEIRSQVEFSEPFAQGLRDLGYDEGRNIAFDRRYAEGKIEILPTLAIELVRNQPDVILAIGTPATRAARSATQTIPIVFTRIADPVGFGLVSSLARPEANLTGVSDLMVETGAKRLELLNTAVPEAKHLGVLWDSAYPAAELREIERAARSLSLELIPIGVRSLHEVQPALQAMVEQRASALIVVPAPIFGQRPQRMAELTAKARLPAMFFNKGFVAAGGLMSYGVDDFARVRRVANYVGKILKGAKPADLPVEQPTKFELVINLKTAKALGLTIPYTLLGLVDEVIE
jgi:putative tryptophan/tyrosine transport system substrate-binding protein